MSIATTITRIIREEIRGGIKRSEQKNLLEGSFNRFKDKIDKGHIPFLIISAFRSLENKAEGEAGNQKRHKALKADLQSVGLSFTEVVGGGQEETEETEIKTAREMTIIATKEERQDINKSKKLNLFQVGKQLCKKYNQFAFIYGFPVETKHVESGEKELGMFIAAYNSDSSGPGNEGRIKEAWAGPWGTIEQATNDDVYYTKIAGTKGTFVENKIKEIKKIKTYHQYDRMKKSYDLKKWQSLLK